MSPLTWISGPRIPVSCDACYGTGRNQVVVKTQMVVETKKEEEKIKLKNRFQILKEES